MDHSRFCRHFHVLITLMIVTALAGCGSEPTHPQEPGAASLNRNVGVLGFNTLTSTGNVRLYWNTFTGKAGDGDHFDWSVSRLPPVVRKVAVEISESSAENHFRRVATHYRNGTDSLAIGELENGRNYYFRLVTYDSTARVIGHSAPLETSPGEPATPEFTFSPENTSIGDYALSPSGSRVAAVLTALSDSGPKADIFLIQVGTGSREQITDLKGMDIQRRETNEYFLREVSWAPDESRLAYTFSPTTSAGDIDYKIWIQPLQPRSATALTAGPVDYGAAWSGATTLTFLRGERMVRKAAEVCAVDLGSNDQVRILTNTPNLYKQSTASHPSQRDVVFAGAGEHAELYRVPGTGGTPEPLLDNKYWNEQSPEWSSDGRWLIFDSDRSGHFEVWAWNPASHSVRQVTRSSDPSIVHQSGQMSSNGRTSFLEVVPHRGPSARKLEIAVTNLTD